MNSAFFEVGAGLGGSWALNKWANRRKAANKPLTGQYRRALDKANSRHTSQRQRAFASGTRSEIFAQRTANLLARKEAAFTGPLAPGQTANSAELNMLRNDIQNPRQRVDRKYAGLADSRRSVKDLRKMSRTLSKAATVFGLFSAGVMGWQMGSELVRGSRAFAESTDDIAARRRSGGMYNGNDEYFDSRAAFTQRQRALQVIHNSQLSTRAAMGSEAGFLHY